MLLINGIILGSVYALLALGYSLVYGVGKIMNLAHGALYILTGYFIYWILNAGYSRGEAILYAIILITLVGALVYLLLIKPLQNTPLGVLIVTFALAYLIQNLISFFMEAPAVTIPGLFRIQLFPGSPYEWRDIFNVVTSISVVILFIIFIKKSKIGKSIRAVSQDREAAQLMGINVNRILLYTMMISTFMVGIAAVVNITNMAEYDGWNILTISFGIVILGGLGSLMGSFIGAYIMAFFIQVTNMYIGIQYSFMVPLFIILIILVIRPQGLFGKKKL